MKVINYAADKYYEKKHREWWENTARGKHLVLEDKEGILGEITVWDEYWRMSGVWPDKWEREKHSWKHNGQREKLWSGEDIGGNKSSVMAYLTWTE